MRTGHPDRAIISPSPIIIAAAHSRPVVALPKNNEGADLAIDALSITGCGRRGLGPAAATVA